MHGMPSVFVLEHDIPEEMVTALNNYLDAYLKEKGRKSLASTLVGQIQHGQQLLMDHNDEKIVEFTNMIRILKSNKKDYYENSNYR